MPKCFILSSFFCIFDLVLFVFCVFELSGILVKEKKKRQRERERERNGVDEEKKEEIVILNEFYVSFSINSGIQTKYGS